jgi:hypothetical protein
MMEKSPGLKRNSSRVASSPLVTMQITPKKEVITPARRPGDSRSCASGMARRIVRIGVIALNRLALATVV